MIFGHPPTSMRGQRLHVGTQKDDRDNCADCDGYRIGGYNAQYSEQPGTRECDNEANRGPQQAENEGSTGFSERLEIRRT